ncbi:MULTISPECIES: hypothetical protein [Bizionia]|uniref:hypothetical protein n=1 Tax=Bizionia TaxID=283785 RepID=UPI0012F8239A|nr:MULTISPECIES: hypothetical protein [Bizionia]
MAKKGNNGGDKSRNNNSGQGSRTNTGLNSSINRSGAENTKGSGSGNRPDRTKKD